MHPFLKELKGVTKFFPRREGCPKVSVLWVLFFSESASPSEKVW